MTKPLKTKRLNADVPTSLYKAFQIRVIENDSSVTGAINTLAQGIISIPNFKSRVDVPAHYFQEPTKRLNCDVPIDLYKALQIQAITEDTSLTALIVCCVYAYIDKTKSIRTIYQDAMGISKRRRAEPKLNFN